MSIICGFERIYKGEYIKDTSLVMRNKESIKGAVLNGNIRYTDPEQCYRSWGIYGC